MCSIPLHTVFLHTLLLVSFTLHFCCKYYPRKLFCSDFAYASCTPKKAALNLNLSLDSIFHPGQTSSNFLPLCAKPCPSFPKVLCERQLHNLPSKRRILTGGENVLKLPPLSTLLLLRRKLSRGDIRCRGINQAKLVAYSQI